MIRSILALLVLLSFVVGCSDSEDPGAQCATKFLTNVNFVHASISGPVNETLTYNDQNLLSSHMTSDIGEYNIRFTYQDKKFIKVEHLADAIPAYVFHFTYGSDNRLQYILRKHAETDVIADSLVFSYDNSGRVIQRGKYVRTWVGGEMEKWSLQTFEYAGNNVSKRVSEFYDGNEVHIYNSTYEYDDKLQPYPAEYTLFQAYIGYAVFSVNNIVKTDYESDDENYERLYDDQGYPTKEVGKWNDTNVVFKTTTFTYACEAPH